MADTERTAGPPYRAGPARRVLHALIALAGWVLFVYWWWLVFRRVSGQEIRYTVLFVAIALVVIVGLTAVWAFHNLRISRRRGRRRRPREVTPDLSRDSVGREVRLPTIPSDCLNARVVTVRIQDGTKVYAPAGAAWPEAAPRPATTPGSAPGPPAAIKASPLPAAAREGKRP